MAAAAFLELVMFCIFEKRTFTDYVQSDRFGDAQIWVHWPKSTQNHCAGNENSVAVLIERCFSRRARDADRPFPTPTINAHGLWFKRSLRLNADRFHDPPEFGEGRFHRSGELFRSTADGCHAHIDQPGANLGNVDGFVNLIPPASYQ